MDLLKHIYIFPGLKEVSKNGKRYQEECGITSSTNENCMGDYDEEKNEMIHRKNYSSSKSLQNKFPNSYLGDENFIVQNDMSKNELIIGNYRNNWNVLFEKLYEILKLRIQSKIQNINNIEQNILGSKKKGNIYISTHHHCLQQKFFNLKHNENGKKYGFRNCTVIKVGFDETLNVKYTVIHVPENNELLRNKSKYRYFNKGELLNDYLVENSFINQINTMNNYPKILDFYNIYFIRHGEALHNLNDYIKENPQHNKSNQEKIILNKLTKRKGMRFTGYRIKPKFFINSCLTDIGVKQAKEIIEKLYDEFSLGKLNDEVFISSPMDRTIETLINATTDDSDFLELKQKFNIMRQNRFSQYERPGKIQRFLSGNSREGLRDILPSAGIRTGSTSGVRMPKKIGGNKKTYKKIKLNKKKYKKTRRRKKRV